jgi:hypothetical protein
MRIAYQLEKIVGEIARVCRQAAPGSSLVDPRLPEKACAESPSSDSGLLWLVYGQVFPKGAEGSGDVIFRCLKREYGETRAGFPEGYRSTWGQVGIPGRKVDRT